MLSRIRSRLTYANVVATLSLFLVLSGGTAVALGPDTQGGPWPLPPGRYVVHYLLADQYRSAGSAPFTVSGGSRS